MITEQTIINCKQIKDILCYDFDSSKITKICDLLLLIFVPLSLVHNPKIYNPNYICNAV